MEHRAGLTIPAGLKPGRSSLLEASKDDGCLTGPFHACRMH
jgi:hypothetical protein